MPKQDKAEKPVRPLQEMADCLERGEAVPDQDLTPYLSSGQAQLRSAGYQLKSKNQYNLGLKRAQEAMEMAAVTEGFTNQNVLMNLLQICDHRKSGADKFRYLTRFAKAAVERGEDALGMEAILQACSLDFSELGISNLSKRTVVDEFAAMYGRIAERQRRRASFGEPRAVVDRRPLRVAHVVPNLIDYSNSPTKLIRNFVHHADRDRFDVRVYSSEVLSKRSKHHFVLTMMTPGTEERAPETLAYLKDHNCPVWLGPVDVDFVEAAHRLAEQLYYDRIDVALYHSSLATSIECVAAHLRPTPLCVNVCIGVPMFAEPTDAAVYFVEANHKRELPFWREHGVDAHFIQGGIDLDEVEAAEPIDRAQLRIGPDVVVLGTVGNHLPARMSNEFCHVVAALMQRHPKAVYLIVGAGDFSRQKQFWGARGVLDRIAFLGGRGDVPRFAQTFDVYLNEFPDGGGASVLEAMAAGKPVVALRAGDNHLQCCGYEYVGPEHGVDRLDLDRYAAVASELIADADRRRQVGEAMFARYKGVCSGQRLVADVEGIVTDLVEQRSLNRRAAVA